MSVERVPVIVIGGSRGANGGVEQFAGRLLALVNRMGVNRSVALPANTAVLKGAGTARSRICEAIRTFKENVKAIRRFAHTSERVVVLLQYGNAFDLVYVLMRFVVPRCDVYVVAHCSSTWSHLSKPALRPIVAGLLRMSSGLGVLSAEQMDLFRGMGVAKITRVHTLLGVSSADVGNRPFRDRPRRSLIFGGRVSPEKGVAEAIELARRLSMRTREAWRLDVYGAVEPQYRRELDLACARAVEAGAEVEIHGYVKFECLLHALANSRFQVYLSVQDAYPLAVLEAIAAGVCPVVYALPGTLEIIERWGGLVAKAGQLDDLVSQMMSADTECSIMLRRSELLQEYSECAVRAAWNGFLGFDGPKFAA